MHYHKIIIVLEFLDGGTVLEDPPGTYLHTLVHRPPSIPSFYATPPVPQSPLITYILPECSSSCTVKVGALTRLMHNLLQCMQHTPCACYVTLLTQTDVRTPQLSSMSIIIITLLSIWYNSSIVSHTRARHGGTDERPPQVIPHCFNMEHTNSSSSETSIMLPILPLETAPKPYQ